MRGRVGWRVVVCVASGPSMDEQQAAQIAEAHAADRVRVIVVNDTWRLLPAADALFASDRAWWRFHVAAVTERFAGECWTSDLDASQRYGVQHIPSVRGEGLSQNPRELVNGGNSGYQAIGLAYNFGARRVILAGYDMQQAPDGSKHWFGDHPENGPDGRRTGLSRSLPLRGWLSRFDRLASDLISSGVECINCTKATALRSFPTGNLAQNLWRPS